MLAKQPGSSGASDLLAERFQLGEVVGAGGMGVVHAGHDLKLDRPVAIKILRTDIAQDAGAKKRFAAEARAAAGLSHPNIVAIYDTGETDGIPFIAMELVAGQTLASLFNVGALECERAVDIMSQVLAGLGAAHEAGILHRDVKPGNLLLTNADVVKIADFGIAAAVGDGLDTTANVLGTPSYLAPERLDGRPATVQSDIWAAGVVLYEAIAGRRPFDADGAVATARAIDSSDPVPLGDLHPGVPEALSDAVQRAMSKDPLDRFENADEMASSIQSAIGVRSDKPGGQTQQIKIADENPPTQRLPASPARSRRQARAGSGTWLVGIMGVFLLAAGLLWLALSGDLTGPGPSAPQPSEAGPAQQDLPGPLHDALRQLERSLQP